MPWASFLVSLYQYLIFRVILLFWCIYKGCGSMEMKTERAFYIFALKIKGIYAKVTVDSQMESCALSLCISCYFPSLMYDCLNISIICTPQVFDWTVYLWLKQYVGKNKQGPRVRPYTWLLCLYTTWWNQTFNKHAMDINSEPSPQDSQLNLLAMLRYSASPCGSSPEP